ncbi:MAG: oligosaccharide flippase family protein [Caldilineaceae bacterium]
MASTLDVGRRRRCATSYILAAVRFLAMSFPRRSTKSMICGQATSWGRRRWGCIPRVHLRYLSAANFGGPINSVATGTYAELKTDRTRLSKAFFRSNALLVRSGFLFAGLLTLLAPEMIRILLGDKWLPMLDIFRLMLIFVLLDPIKLTIASLFSATGNPQIMVWTQLIQLAIPAIGLFTLGQWYGTLGVAVSVDVMIVVGVALLLWQSRKFVDYSIRHLFLMPTVSTLWACS